MKKLKRLWFKWVIYPYLRRNGAVCMVAMGYEVSALLLESGIGAEHVNKWLQATGQKTIKAYVREKTGVRVFHSKPTPEQRATITGRLIWVACIGTK